MAILFRSFGSGSSGNSYYFGTDRRGILIDAGVNARAIRAGLREMKLDFECIDAVLVTHDHADHIRAVGTLGERFHIPVYATAAVHAGIDRNYGVTQKLRTAKKFFTLKEPFTVSGMTISTFPISHDATENMGYCIEYQGLHFVLATDIGAVSNDLEAAVRWANYLVIEANHDEEILLAGSYPSYLKARILSDKGHQSNATCAKLIENNYHDDLRRIWLCHLSEENNQPEVAFQTVQQALPPETSTILEVLQRKQPSVVYELKMKNEK